MTRLSKERLEEIRAVTWSPHAMEELLSHIAALEQEIQALIKLGIETALYADNRFKELQAECAIARERLGPAGVKMLMDLKSERDKATRALQYFSETGIYTRASEDGEFVDITFMAEEALK